MVETFKELSSLSRQLNIQSNKLASIISSINKNLSDLNFGVAVWIENDPVISNDWRDEHYDVEVDHRVVRTCRATLLGYCQVEDAWQLAVKDVTLSDDPDNTYNYEISNSIQPHSLLSASREERIKAMRLLPKLLDLIKEEGEKLIEQISQAEAAAKKLDGKE